MKSNIKSIWGSINNFLNKIILSKWVYLFFTTTFIIITIKIFRWGREIRWGDSNYILDNTLLGTFGDFFGGVLGTIFGIISVLLVIQTFKYQQRVTENDKKKTETEQFNNLFFELLNLYQSEVNELCGCVEKFEPVNQTNQDKVKVKRSEIKYNNKDFFDIEKKVLQENFRNDTSYEKNRLRSVNFYMVYYIKNRSKISAYLRTLYQIFTLIDSSPLINEQERKDYAKIIRAQLTESELFFLRYNAMTLYGNSTIKYLNKYNILKHLPAFELLEFKDWWRNMNGIDKESINILYYLICKALKKLYSDTIETKKIVTLLPQENCKYKISLQFIKDYDFSIIVDINKREKFFTNEYKGIDTLNEKQIQQLLDCLVKELFMYSNFERFNITKELETYSNPIQRIKHHTIINSGIRNKEQHKLIKNYSQLLGK